MRSSARPSSVAKKVPPSVLIAAPSPSVSELIARCARCGVCVCRRGGDDEWKATAGAWKATIALRIV
jgi:hypothetical protein